MFSIHHWKVKVIRAFLSFLRNVMTLHILIRKNYDNSKNVSMF